MLQKIGLTWIISFLIANNVFAQTLPKGQRLDIGPGDTRQCYKFDEYRDLLKYQIDCQACNQTNDILNQKLITQSEIIDKQDKILKLKDDDLKIAQGEKDRLFKMWSEENLQRHQLENKPSFGGWLGWTAAGVFALSTIFLTGYLVAR